MIARVWKGWTKIDKAGDYETLLRETIFPSFTKIEGYLGGTIYREIQDVQADEIEFIITSYFDSIDAVKRFAGHTHYSEAVIEPEAKELLIKVDTHAKHYEVSNVFQLENVFK